MKHSTLKLLFLTVVMLLSHTLWADVTFKFKAPSDWSKCYLWAWDDNQKQLASSSSSNWPGDATMTLGSDGYYTYTLKTSVTKVNFLFNNGASSGAKQTVDASTTKTKFMGRYGSTNTQGHYDIIEETFVDTDDSGDDDVVTPDDPQPTGEVKISAIRSRLSINTNDFTDFAGLYVSKLPTVEGGTLSSYAWEYSTNNTTWSAYSAGDGASWDNIRPNKAGYYRCTLTYDVNGETQTAVSNTLQITNKGGSSVSFSSNLPVVLVRTSKDFPTPPSGYPTTEQVAELKAKRSVDVKILWNKNGGNVSNSDINNKDMLHYDRKARMNYRGSSSLNNPKKSFAFVTGDKNCDSKKLGEVKTKKFAMFDGDSHKDWVMYASYPDATFMRNILSYHQYAKMTGLWGVKCRYVEMYLDGEYQGIYVFMDKMTQDETRINVNEETGYIVRFDKTDMVDRYDGYSGANEDYKRCTFITSNTGKKTIATYNMQVDQAFEIEYPEREDIATFDDNGNVTDDSAWEAKVNEVKAMFVAMENAILANDYDKLAQIIDYESWADWFIFNEFSRNADAYRISCVFQINSASEKIVANPIWDYELGLGNQDTKTSGLMVEDPTYYNDDFPTPFWWTGKGKSGCNGILGDCKFKAIVKERWAKHTAANGALNSTVLNAKIDSLANVLSQGAGSREKSKWNTYSSSSTSTLKSWITNRTSGLNSIINGWTVCDEDDDQDTPTASYYIAGAVIVDGVAVAGDKWCCGLRWDPAGCALTNNTVTYTGLAAGEYKFKVTDGTWSKNWGYAALSSTTGLTKDIDGNVVVTLSKASDVTITFNPITEKISVTIKESSVPELEVDFTIAAIRDRLSINTNDFTDFAGLYVSELPKVEGGELASYKWQYSTDKTTWVDYSYGDGATWDNIRPNVAGYYRCVLTYDLAGEVTTYTSNVISITDNGGTAVTFSSKLPVFLVRTSKDFPNVTYLDNDGVAEMKAKRSVDVKILWNEEGGAVTNADVNNADMLHYDRKGRMNYRGSSSLRNDKKSYAFVTGDKNCDPKKLGEVKTKKFGMFGAAAQKDWVLYASAPDATYMRNVLSFHQYAQMTGLWGVKCRYVELYIDGSYKGIYVFMDKITQDENRVNINEDTGYIVKFDKTDMVDSYDSYVGANEDYKRNTFITSNTGRRNIRTYQQYVDQAFEIDFPEREDIAEFDDDGNLVDDSAWDAKVTEVKGMFTAMENAILANDYDKLATIIDYESWADWFIMNEFSRNADAYRISCVFTIASAGDKIVANPIWDYELGWGYQNTTTTGLMVEENIYYSDAFPTPFWWTGRGKSGCNGILGDCRFKEIVKERWAKYIAENGALNTTVLNAKIDSLASNLATSSTRTSVSTSSLKSWVSNRTTGLNSVISAWEGCPIPPFVVTPTITNLKCNGGNDGSISLEVSGAVAPYTYTWTYPNGTTANTKDISGLTAGVYTLRIEDSVGEIYQETYEVTEPEALDASINVKNVTCGGYPDGMILDLVMIGGTAPVDFSCYDDQKVLSDIVNLKGGDYSVVLTDANGCTFEKEFYIYEPEKLELVVNSVFEPSEFGASDGSIDITVTGGTGSYKYQWSGHNFEADTEDINNLVSNIYELTVKDENNCSVYERIELSEPAPKPFEVNSYVTNVKCNGGNDGSISLEVAGSVPPYTYTWTYPNGTEVNSKDISGLAAGVYTLRIEDSIGESYFETYEVTEPEALNISANVKDVTCNGFADGAIDLKVTGGTLPYNYSCDGTTQEDLSNLKGGNYRVTITDANGCAFANEYVVAEPEALDASINVKNVTCGGYPDGMILDLVMIGGTAPVDFSCYDDQKVLSDIVNLKGGDYSVVLTDANGCTFEKEFYIYEPEKLELVVNSVFEPSEFGASDGSIDITVTGGTGSYKYQWSGHNFEADTEDINNLVSNIYELTVKDENNCSVYERIELSEPAPKPFEVNSYVTNVKCNGRNDGSISLEVAGSVPPYTYTWTYPNGTEVNTKDISGLAAGVYTLLIVDNIGESYFETYEVIEPEKLNAELISGGTIPYCKSIGELTFDVTGGVAPYTYELHKGSIYGEIVSTSSEAFNLEADAYYAYVYDANGCRAYTKQIINSTEELRLIINSVIEPSEYGAKDGSIDVTVNGGTIPYDFTWRGTNFNSNSEDVYGLGAGIYKITVTDYDGCYVNEAIELKQPEKVKYNYFTVLLDGDCYGEYTFSEDNDNRILFTEEVESSNLKTYTIIANCDASIFENNIYVHLEEAGVYDVEIIFNGDYETPNFTYNVTKKSIPTEVQDIESDVIINVEKGLISVYNREFSIYNVIGQDVTVYNGGLLPGVYMVQIGDKSTKVIMK